MSYTKRQFVTGALEEIGLASYVFDMQPDALDTALRRLDAMMASWNALGIRVGYPIPTNPQDSDLDEETSVPDSANEAIITNLALRVAPGFGKQPAQWTMATARGTYNTLLSLAALPPQVQLPGTMPAGAGNKPWIYNNPFLTPPADRLDVGQDSQLDWS